MSKTGKNLKILQGQLRGKMKITRGNGTIIEIIFKPVHEKECQT